MSLKTFNESLSRTLNKNNNIYITGDFNVTQSLVVYYGILCTSISDHYAIFCISKHNMNQARRKHFNVGGAKSE